MAMTEVDNSVSRRFCRLLSARAVRGYAGEVIQDMSVKLE